MQSGNDQFEVVLLRTFILLCGTLLECLLTEVIVVNFEEHAYTDLIID